MSTVLEGALIRQMLTVAVLLTRKKAVKPGPAFVEGFRVLSSGAIFLCTSSTRPEQLDIPETTPLHPDLSLYG